MENEMVIVLSTAALFLTSGLAFAFYKTATLVETGSVSETPETLDVRYQIHTTLRPSKDGYLLRVFLPDRQLYGIFLNHQGEVRFLCTYTNHRMDFYSEMRKNNWRRPILTAIAAQEWSIAGEGA